MTSMYRLRIARTRKIRWQHAMLAIDYDLKGQRFVFTYFEAALIAKPWVTT